jgi:hypothetical protein
MVIVLTWDLTQSYPVGQGGETPDQRKSEECYVRVPLFQRIANEVYWLKA